MSSSYSIKGYVTGLERRLEGVPRPPRYVFKAGSVVGFLGLWWFFVRAGVLGFDLISTPPEALSALVGHVAGEPMTDGGESLYVHSYYTLYRVSLGLGLAVALAIPLGLLNGWSASANRYVQPAFELLRPIPPVAWVPIALIAFSSDLLSIVWVVFVGAFFPLLINTIEGVRSIDEEYVRAVRSLGGSDWELLRHVILPAALPSIVTGTMISVGIGWIAVVAAEMLSGNYGIGYITYQAYRLMQTETVIVGIITLGTYGAVSSYAVSAIGDRLTDWNADGEAR
ncbi:ABC transporter permease [Halomicrobium salinisoli]|uniref:ABC transporter permease n=1 Tax=Halomicrobium salinisoli TaxID=2878391 RepID=UPI001CF07FB9|nr:ABC transporter permease [Halomicrobium salinisoli]